jgi:Domain of unknown function (DUF4126)
MEIIQLLGSVMGLGFVSGLNLYATVLTLGLGMRFHLITLSPQFSKLEILTSWYVLIAAAILFILEAFADKIPWVDSLWDAVHTVVRPLGAAVLGATAIGSIDPQAAFIAAMCGGVALTGHSAKAGTRLLVNHSPEPVSNIVLSVAEDILASAGTWLAVKHPVVMFVLVLLFLIAFFWFAPKAFRLMRVEYTAALALLTKLYMIARAYVMNYRQRSMVAAGTNLSIPVASSEGSVNGDNSSPWSDSVPEYYLHYIDNKLPPGDVKSCIRCVAGKGIKGLRWSVGYLQVRDNELLFVTRRSFHFRNHQIDRQTIEDVNIKRRILLDRLILRANGKQQVFSLFKYPPHSDNLLRLLDKHKRTR